VDNPRGRGELPEGLGSSKKHDAKSGRQAHFSQVHFSQASSGRAASQNDLPGRADNEAIEESELFYRKLYDNISEGFAMVRLLYDENRVPVDSVVLKTNAAFEEQTGLRSADIIGVTTSTYRPNQEQAWLVLQDEVLKSGEPMHFEQYRADSNRWYDIILYPYGPDTFCQIMRDITAHKQTTGELRESRELLNAIIQAQAVSVTVFRAVRDDYNVIVDFESVYGSDSDVISQLNFQDSERNLTAGLRLSAIFPNFTEAGLLGGFRKVVEHEELFDQEYQDIADRSNWYHLKATKFRDGIILNAESISERKKIEQDLLRVKEELAKRATDKYLTIFNTIDEGFAIIEIMHDENGDPADIQIIEANAAAGRLTGHQTMAGKRFLELWPQSGDGWLQRFAEVDASGKSVRFTIWSSDFGRCLNINAAPIIIDGKKQIAIVVNDMTDTMLTEEALRRSEGRYRTLVKYAPVGIYEIDFRTRKFTSVNDIMSQMTGYTREELLRMNALDILDGPSQQAFQLRVHKWLAGEAPPAEIDYRVICKDGHEIYAHLYVQFLKDEYGNPQGATVIGHDVTERVKAEKALRESEERLRELIQAAAAGDGHCAGNE
jgi:PAS domain S-box-containing protein